MSIYQVVIKGCKDSKNIDQVAGSLAVLFKCNPEQLRPMLISKDFIVKRSLDLEAAKKYRKALEDTGCVAVIESELSFDLPSSSQASTSENQLPSADNSPLLKENGILPTQGFRNQPPTKTIPKSNNASSTKGQPMPIGGWVVVGLMLLL